MVRESMHPQRAIEVDLLVVGDVDGGSLVGGNVEAAVEQVAAGGG